MRWNDQIRCFGGEIESRSSDRDSPQIDQHTLSPTAVLAATDPNVAAVAPAPPEDPQLLLRTRSSAPAIAEDPQFRRLRLVAASTAVTKRFLSIKISDSLATAATFDIFALAVDLSARTRT